MKLMMPGEIDDGSEGWECVVERVGEGGEVRGAEGRSDDGRVGVVEAAEERRLCPRVDALGQEGELVEGGDADGGGGVVEGEGEGGEGVGGGEDLVARAGEGGVEQEDDGGGGGVAREVLLEGLVEGGGVRGVEVQQDLAHFCDKCGSVIGLGGLFIIISFLCFSFLLLF